MFWMDISFSSDGDEGQSSEEGSPSQSQDETSTSIDRSSIYQADINQQAFSRKKQKQ